MGKSNPNPNPNPDCEVLFRLNGEEITVAAQYEGDYKPVTCLTPPLQSTGVAQLFVSFEGSLSNLFLVTI